MMKRWISMLLASALCAAALAGCSERKPSLSEVEKAIRDGNMTVEDALQKGYITEEWADRTFPESSVPATDKLEVNRIGDFETKTVTGEDYTRDDLPEGAFFFAFLDPTTEAASKMKEELVSAYDDVKQAGGDIVLALSTEQNSTAFSDAPFAVIVYNDSLKQAVGKNDEMISGQNIGSWCVQRAFLSAWYTDIKADSLRDSAAGFVETAADHSEEPSRADDVKPAEDEALPELEDNMPVAPMTDNSTQGTEDEIIPDDPGMPVEVKG